APGPPRHRSPTPCPPGLICHGRLPRALRKTAQATRATTRRTRPGAQLSTMSGEPASAALARRFGGARDLRPRAGLAGDLGPCAGLAGDLGPCAGLAGDLGPGVAQPDRAVEHEPRRSRVAIAGKIALPLELHGTRAL